MVKGISFFRKGASKKMAIEAQKQLEAEKASKRIVRTIVIEAKSCRDCQSFRAFTAPNNQGLLMNCSEHDDSFRLVQGPAVDVEIEHMFRGCITHPEVKNETIKSEVQSN